MKQDKWTKLWNMISPPVIYLFIQMGVEFTIAMLTVLYENKRMYDTYGMIDNAGAVTEKVQNMVNINVSYITVVSAVFAAVFFGRIYINEKNNNYFLHKNNSEKINIIVMIAFGVTLSMVTGSILSIFDGYNEYGNYEAASELLLRGNIVYRMFALGVITPVSEEIIYRGLVYNRIKMTYGKIYGIVISSLLFGVFHFNLVQGVYAFIIGMALAYCYEITGDLKIPVYIHMSINFLTVLLDYYGLNDIIDGNNILKVALILLGCVIMVYLIEIILKKSWKRGK